MDWLRNSSLLGAAGRSAPNTRALFATDEEWDPQACYDSFVQHWQQALKIIKRNQLLPSQDDVLSVVNHMEQMSALLQYDIKKLDHIQMTPSKSMEYMLQENVLDKLYEWGIKTGKYVNAVRSEQLKLYEMLICQSRHVLLVHNAFMQPLLKILGSCLNEVFPRQMQKLLVNLLYQLCIVLMQNVDLVDLFFPQSVKHEKYEKKPRFIICALLIPFVHGDDNVGMQARDSVLLCMSLSKKNASVREYIADVSNICALLASGLGGLYSELPHVLDDIVAPDWRRLTPDDVNDVKDLTTFVTSLEFSNSVAQMAHASIVAQLQEFVHMGFLIPIFGPALLQARPEEQIAVTVYLELILRTVSEPGLLRPMLRFLLGVEYDGRRLLDMLMDRINAEDEQLALVSLALFETLVDLNCEDVMLELVYHHLQPCRHLMFSQRKVQLPLDAHCESAEKFLMLAPDCGEGGHLEKGLDGRTINWNHYGGQPSLYGNYHAYLCDARNKINACRAACSNWTHQYTGCENTDTTDEGMSLPSLGESSGYESLKIKLDEPIWQVSLHANEHNHVPKLTAVCPVEGGDASASAGPFLTLLMEKLKNVLSNSFYANLHLTGLISRLAAYSHPLLRAYLLDHSLVLQPNVPSLFQVLGSLKQQIDEFMSRQPERLSLTSGAKHFLLERETRLVHARRTALDRNSSPHGSLAPSMSSHDDTTPSTGNFQRNGPKRRSLTQSLSSLSSMFGRRQSSTSTTGGVSLSLSPGGGGVTSMAGGDMQMQLTSQASTEDTRAQWYPKFNDAQRVAMCAVLLDEWTKELAALAQEHAIAQFAEVLLK